MINDLKRNLNESTKEDLIKSIVDLYQKNAFVKDYYTIKYGLGNSLSILKKHKDIINNEFFPERGEGRGRLSVAKKAITDFKKLSDDKTAIAELMIFYVESGVNYTDCYGDIDWSFYRSMATMYDRTLEFITINNLMKLFGDRCLKIVEDTVDMGWGFHDQLVESYYDYIDD